MKSTLKAPEGRKGCMRYVIILVALGLLVLAVGTGGTYTAIAANGEVGYLVELQNRDSSLIVIVNTQEIEKAHASYLTLKEEERRKQEAEQKRVNAINQFGLWGPDLVGAAEMYGQSPYDLYNVMSCESDEDPYADNGVDIGLFQFLPSTWAGTPYGGASIYDGQAQIYATAWMWTQGRRGEWPVCGRL